MKELGEFYLFCKIRNEKKKGKKEKVSLLNSQERKIAIGI